jgi:hypothetical protein
MNLQPEDDVAIESIGEGDLTANREQLAERLHFLFRQAGNNPPAIELEQQITTYRLTESPQ